MCHIVQVKWSNPPGMPSCLGMHTKIPLHINIEENGVDKMQLRGFFCKPLDDIVLKEIKFIVFIVLNFFLTFGSVQILTDCDSCNRKIQDKSSKNTIFLYNPFCKVITIQSAALPQSTL